MRVNKVSLFVAALLICAGTANATTSTKSTAVFKPATTTIAKPTTTVPTKPAPAKPVEQTKKSWWPFW